MSVVSITDQLTREDGPRERKFILDVVMEKTWKVCRLEAIFVVKITDQLTREDGPREGRMNVAIEKPRKV